MTNPYSRPGASDDGWAGPVAANEPAGGPHEATIPIVPEAGYANPSYPPPLADRYEDTLVEPLPQPRGPAPGYANPAFDPAPEYQNFGYTPAPTYQNPAYSPVPVATPEPTPPPDPNAYANPPFEAYAPTPYSSGGQAPAVVGWQDSRAPVIQGYFAPQPALADHPRSVLVLVLGLLGFVTWGLTSPFAWVIGGQARRDIRRNPGRWRSSPALTAGWVLGILVSLFWIALIGFIVLLVSLAATF